jgi:hypothetical protein
MWGKEGVSAEKKGHLRIYRSKGLTLNRRMEIWRYGNVKRWKVEDRAR